MSKVQRFTFPVAPYSEESRSFNVFEADPISDELAAAFDLVRRHVDVLEQAVLARAFRGGLVPHDLRLPQE